MKTPKLLCTIAAIALAQGSLFAVNTDPVGFVSVTVPANSDAILAVPLNRTSEFKGLTNGFSATSGTVTITVAGTPGWTAGQFAPLTTANKTYALQFASGTKEGMILPIVNNGTNTVVVTVSATDDLTGVLASGEQIDIMPYWTPSSLLSNVPVGTEFLGFEGVGAGTNHAAPQLFGNTGAGTWEDEITSDDVSNIVIGFGRSYVLRNNSAASVTISIVGSVPMSSHRFTFSTLAGNTDQDTRFGYLCPVAEPVTSLGIPAVAGDAILGFDNSASGKNKSAATIYAFDGTKWVDDISGDPLTAADTLKPGFGYIYRKYRTGTAQKVVWQHVQSYLQ